MPIVVRRPPPALAPFVESIWYFEGTFPHARERILPTGRMQLLVNLQEDELRSYHGEGGGSVKRSRGAALSGAYSTPHVIDTAEQRAIAGVDFRPGGAFPFFAIPADEVRETHVDLDLLWGRAGAILRERLLEAATPEATLRMLEAALLSRAVRPLERDAAVAFAVAALARNVKVGAVTDRVGMSAARFIRHFAARVGLGPKRFARVLRFQRVVRAGGNGRAIDWAEVAAECGYADQAHLIHDFRSFSGLTPTAYRPRSPDAGNHVPLPA